MSEKKLVFIKLIHTFFWALFAGAIFYLDYKVLVNSVDHSVYFAIGLVLIEVGILLSFKWKCPLTLVAAKYTTNRRDNFDIYLPEWLARHNKVIFTILFVAGLVGLALRAIA